MLVETKKVLADIKGIDYTYSLCSSLKQFSLTGLPSAIEKSAAFILEVGLDKQIAVSWWVSPKRTRSYPYARVYDTLGFLGRKVTIIPVFKDEGKEGDRDFLQWDTVSLMSLLDVYVIISYYDQAKKSNRYRHKITNQRFNMEFVSQELQKLVTYQSSPLHWNMEQVNQIGQVGQMAIDAYRNISQKLGIEMHSESSAYTKIHQLYKNKEIFMLSSRDLAQQAQMRESRTTQPKEKISGEKGMISIKNYLGGWYYLTVDEIVLENNIAYLMECKHSTKKTLPSLTDIKDGLIKMVLFSNLENVSIEDKTYIPRAVLKLTSTKPFSFDSLTNAEKKTYSQLLDEAQKNEFELRI